MQAYSDPTRETDPHALPDIEIFYHDGRVDSMALQAGDVPDDEPENYEPGWYYWYCFPGCLPDSEPVGPFESAEKAEAAAQEDATS